MPDPDPPGLRAVPGGPETAAAIFDACPDAVVLADDRLRFADANPAACALLGYSRAEFLRLSVPDVLAVADRPRAAADWGRFRAAGSDDGGRRLRRKDGTEVEVDVRAVADVRPGLHLAIWHDVTARQRAEDRLRESEERLRVALAAADMGTWLWRIPPDEQVLDDGLCRLLGLPPGAAVTGLDGFLRSVHAEDRDRVRAEFERCREAGCDFTAEFRVVRPAGSVRWLRDQGKSFPGPDGKPLFLAGACVDVTERRAMEDELRRARDELERRVEERTAELRESQQRALQAERLAAIGQTVAALAHEGRNALQRADGCLLRLDLRLGDRPGERDLVGRARAALADLEHLFDDVRNYAAPLRLDRQACDLRALWRAAWEQVAGQRPGRDARLEEVPGGPEPVCEGDPFRLGQVFTNLFANALDACPGPARVAVSWREADLGGRPALAVTVADNGPGFTPEQRQRALEPFYTTKAKGTGLGLAIAGRVVEAHGGSIALGGGDGGARVTLTLPRRQTGAAER